MKLNRKLYTENYVHDPLILFLILGLPVAITPYFHTPIDRAQAMGLQLDECSCTSCEKHGKQHPENNSTKTFAENEND